MNGGDSRGPIRIRRGSDLDESLVAPDDVPIVVFDFDGTLTEQRGSWGLLYRLFGVEPSGTDRTEAYWEGELTFQEWCDGNLADWRERGVTRTHLDRAREALKLTTGANSLLGALSDEGIPFGVLSSGVGDLVRRIDPYEPAFVEANEIHYDGDTPVGVDARVGPSDKGEALCVICEERGVTPAETVYVGDSYSDTEAFEEAGVAVLFDPTDHVDDRDQALVDVVVEERDLSLVATVIGVERTRPRSFCGEG